MNNAAALLMPCRSTHSLLKPILDLILDLTIARARGKGAFMLAKGAALTGFMYGTYNMPLQPNWDGERMSFKAFSALPGYGKSVLRAHVRIRQSPGICIRLLIAGLHGVM